jgi:5-methylcytosine-specific restriction endonuclease McrA
MIKGLKRYSIFMKFEGHCSYCGCPLNYAQMQIDHFYPKSLFRSQKLVKNIEAVFKRAFNRF